MDSNRFSQLPVYRIFPCFHTLMELKHKTGTLVEESVLELRHQAERLEGVIQESQQFMGRVDQEIISNGQKWANLMQKAQSALAAMEQKQKRRSKSLSLKKSQVKKGKEKRDGQKSKRAIHKIGEDLQKLGTAKTEVQSLQSTRSKTLATTTRLKNDKDARNRVEHSAEEGQAKRRDGFRLVRNLKLNKIILYYWLRLANNNKIKTVYNIFELARKKYHFCRGCLKRFENLTALRAHIKQNPSQCGGQPKRQSDKVTIKQFNEIIRNEVKIESRTIYRCACSDEVYGSEQGYVEHIREWHEGRPPLYASHGLEGGRVCRSPDMAQELVVEDILLDEVYLCGPCLGTFFTIYPHRFVEHLQKNHPDGFLDQKNSHLLHTMPAIQPSPTLLSVTPSKVAPANRLFFQTLLSAYEGPYECDLCSCKMDSYEEYGEHFTRQESCIRNFHHNNRNIRVMFNRRHIRKPVFVPLLAMEGKMDSHVSIQEGNKTEVQTLQEMVGMLKTNKRRVGRMKLMQY